MKLNVRHPTPNAQRRTRTAPVALTIAGSDCSAGAGVQADLKTFSALGVYGLTAITCVVAETPGKVSRIEPLNTEIVREQLAVLFRNFPIAAAKTGLHAIGYAKFYSRSHNAVIRVYDEAGNMLEAHEHAGEFKEW